MKKVLVIASSPRKNGNSNELAKRFAAGATESGNEVEIVYLYDKTISFCKGCLACQTSEQCVIHDDANEICQMMLKADSIAFATPIYYYSVSGQLKTMLDRANPLFPADYSFRNVYLLATAADNDMSAVKGAEKALQGWVDCFERATLKDVIFAGGVTNISDINGHTALQKAYEAGKNA